MGEQLVAKLLNYSLMYFAGIVFPRWEDRVFLGLEDPSNKLELNTRVDPVDA